MPQSMPIKNAHHSVQYLTTQQPELSHMVSMLKVPQVCRRRGWPILSISGRGGQRGKMGNRYGLAKEQRAEDERIKHELHGCVA